MVPGGGGKGELGWVWGVEFRGLGDFVGLGVVVLGSG